MYFEVKDQVEYSRSLLLLRTIFGWLYIVLPHAFLLLCVGIYAGILQFLSFWAILFTGRFPESWFEFLVEFQRWGLRVNASMLNLTDEYPEFGIGGESESVSLEVPYPENMSRVDVLIRTIFGSIYVVFPHGAILYFRTIVSQILVLLSWFAVLFTGVYPERWHEFQVNTLRWQTRVNLYMAFMLEDYPPFSGKPDDEADIPGYVPKDV